MLRETMCDNMYLTIYLDILDYIYYLKMSYHAKPTNYNVMFKRLKFSDRAACR